MLKNIFRIITFAMALLAAHACEDRLSILDPNRLSSDQFYKNQSDAVAAVDAIYNALIVDGMYQRIFPTIGDGRGDEIFSRGGFPMWELTANFIVPPTEEFVRLTWLGHYIMITRANQALEKVPGIPDVNEELRSRLLGQAYFLRGLAYFNLANMFENPVIVLKVPVGASEFYPSNQGVTQAAVYDQVESDLTQAISLLPDSYATISGPDVGDVGRATKGAARSLMGKVLLYQGDHAGALTHFQAVVQSGVYALSPNYASLFSQDPIIEEQNNAGKIFWAEFTTSTNPGDNWGGDPNATWKQFSALAPTYSRGDFGDYAPNAFLYNEMREERTIDNRLDPRYHATILSFEPTEGYTTAYGNPWPYAPGDYWIKKYTLAATGGNPFTCGIDYHIIRYADVVLMYAECLANTGNIPAAAAQVQNVRDQANLPDRETEFAALSLNAFMEQLAHERIMELAVEGHRFYDVKRWGWLDNPAKLAELRANDAEFNNYVPNRKYLPIPQAELDLNVNLVGNSVNTNN
jgi:starch-binding outer membrane protein, SusD/RagB family